jgi:hypothetical protein
VVPIGHLWTRSAQPWIRIPDDALSFPGQPDDFMVLVQTWKRRNA